MRLRPFQPQALTQILQQQVSGLPGTVGVQVTDLMSGLSAGLNPMETFYPASTIKVPIAMTVLWLADQNRISLDQPITYLEEDFERGTGTLQATIKPGDQIPIRKLLELMITVSDNIARNMLERYIGSGTIRQYMLNLGVMPPYTPGQNRVTPYGMNQILVALDSGRSGLSRTSTQMLLQWMEETVFRDRIPRYLPQDVVVANKIGTWPGEVHDVGLVYAPDRSFAISALTKGIPEEQAKDVIGRIAQAVYQYEDSLTR